ncbi:MAG: acetylglutamate kinase, partial [Actinomycetota bacterium]
MIVIKFGGNALAGAKDNKWLDLIAAKQRAGLKMVLVHGGGPQIDSELSLHGIERRFIEGFRYTDEATFNVVEMVLGSIAQNFVRSFRARNVDALSMSGSDVALFEPIVKRSPSGQDLGQVGEVERVDTRILEILMAEGVLPIVSSMSSTQDGKGVNVNADLAAGALAGALRAEKIIFMTDVKGIYRTFPDEGSLISECTFTELVELLPSFSGGMIPKVTAIISAMEKGAISA